MKRATSFTIASLLVASPSFAEVILACNFPSLPDVVMRFPDDISKPKTMEVASRPAVPSVEGDGAGRLISADVDGYSFIFSPANLSLDVNKSGEQVGSEIGECITMGGPVNETPLLIEKAATVPAGDASVPAKENSPVLETVADAASKGKWKLEESKSALDDTKTVVLTLDSTDYIRGRFGDAGPAKMYVRCLENRTSVFFVLNDLFLSDIQGYGEIDYRVDDLKASTASMTASTDNAALGLWNGGVSIPFINKIMAGERLVMRVTPYNESPVEFSFDIDGLGNALPPLKEACGW